MGWRQPARGRGRTRADCRQPMAPKTGTFIRRLMRSIEPSPLPQRSYRLRARLWLAGASIALFLITLVVASHIADPKHSFTSAGMGDDLIPSYMAGAFVRQGRPDLLMDYREAVRFQAHLRRIEGLEQHGR